MKLTALWESGEEREEIWKTALALADPELVDPVRLVAPSVICFFNDTATTNIYPLSLHDALPISPSVSSFSFLTASIGSPSSSVELFHSGDRKSTRLNSSHTVTSYAVFCLKK